MNSTTGSITICVDFIENHSEEDFREHYETYNRLVDDYGQLVVDEFIEEFDTDAIEHFEDMFQGQYNSGGDFAEQICNRLWLCNKRVTTLD